MRDAPYKCQVFTCVNNRHGERKSCADGGSREIRLALKQALAARGLPKLEVRASQSLCQGRCEEGPNVMIYPQNKWFSGVTLQDVDAIADTVEALVAKEAVQN